MRSTFWVASSFHLIHPTLTDVGHTQIKYINTMLFTLTIIPVTRLIFWMASAFNLNFKWGISLIYKLQIYHHALHPTLTPIPRLLHRAAISCHLIWIEDSTEMEQLHHMTQLNPKNWNYSYRLHGLLFRMSIWPHAQNFYMLNTLILRTSFISKIYMQCDHLIEIFSIWKVTLDCFY
jgi:hypothetical protein